MRFKKPAQQATKPQVKREMRSVLCHSLAADSTERGSRHCSGEFEHLLDLHRWCGLRSNTNRFKVHTAAAGMHTILTSDIRTAREMKLSLSM